MFKRKRRRPWIWTGTRGKADASSHGNKRMLLRREGCVTYIRQALFNQPRQALRPLVGVGRSLVLNGRRSSPIECGRPSDGGHAHRASKRSEQLGRGKSGGVWWSEWTLPTKMSGTLRDSTILTVWKTLRTSSAPTWSTPGDDKRKDAKNGETSLKRPERECTRFTYSCVQCSMGCCCM